MKNKEKEIIILKCNLSVAEDRIKKLEAEIKDIPDEWSHELMQAEIDSLESCRSEFERSVAEEYYQKYKDSSFSETLREELRQSYNKRFNDEEQSFVKKLGIVQRREAKKINEVALLMAEILYLNSRLRVQPKPPLGDIVHKAAMDRVKETDALRVEVMSIIRREKIDACLVVDPWKLLVKDVERVGALNLDLLKLVKHELKLNHDFNASINGGNQYVEFISNKHGGSWKMPFKHIDTMADLKKIYESFKEIYG